MPTIEDQLHSWLQHTEPRVKTLVKDTSDHYLGILAESDFPDDADRDRAAAALRRQALDALDDDGLIAALPNPPGNPNAIEALRGAWFGMIPDLLIPPPRPQLELAPWRLALAAATGSLLGLLVIGALLNLLLDMRATGMLFGAVLGAGAATYGVLMLARSEKLRKRLALLLGLASVVQVFASFASVGLGGLWGRLGGSLFKRILAFAAMVALLVFTRESRHFDSASYQPVVETTVRRWLEFSLLLLFTLSREPRETQRVAVFDPGLGRAIVDLQRSTTDDLALAAEAVILEARRGGLEGVDGPARFTAAEQGEKRELLWTAELATEYRPFGWVEDGDRVVVEQEPVLQNGVVIDLGRVRKLRGTRR
jgi:hypothetical protein